MATPLEFRGEAFAPGEGHQNLKLWYIRQIYEKVENESFYGPPVVLEEVYFATNSDVLEATVVAINQDGENCTFDLVVPSRANSSGHVPKYRNIKRHRIARKREYFCSDKAWMEFAAQATGFPESEVVLHARLPLNGMVFFDAKTFLNRYRPAFSASPILSRRPSFRIPRAPSAGLTRKGRCNSQSSSSRGESPRESD